MISIVQVNIDMKPTVGIRESGNNPEANADAQISFRVVGLSSAAMKTRRSIGISISININISINISIRMRS